MAADWDEQTAKRRAAETVSMMEGPMERRWVFELARHLVFADCSGRRKAHLRAQIWELSLELETVVKLQESMAEWRVVMMAG